MGTHVVENRVDVRSGAQGPWTSMKKAEEERSPRAVRGVELSSGRVKRSSDFSCHRRRRTLRKPQRGTTGC
jgi:hypothetical protein